MNKERLSPSDSSTDSAISDGSSSQEGSLPRDIRYAFCFHIFPFFGEKNKFRALISREKNSDKKTKFVNKKEKFLIKRYISQNRKISEK